MACSRFVLRALSRANNVFHRRKPPDVFSSFSGPLQKHVSGNIFPVALMLKHQLVQSCICAHFLISYCYLFSEEPSYSFLISLCRQHLPLYRIEKNTTRFGIVSRCQLVRSMTYNRSNSTPNIFSCGNGWRRSNRRTSSARLCHRRCSCALLLFHNSEHRLGQLIGCVYIMSLSKQRT